MTTRTTGAFFLVSLALQGQTAVKEPDTLQLLLSEVRQLRQSIEAMTVASQRAQIALHSLQIQEAAVSRTTQRLDAARNSCSVLEQNRKHFAADITAMEATLSSGATLEGEALTFKSRLPNLKRGLEEQTAEFQACQQSEADVSNQLRNDQAKLLELQDRIERLDKTLEKLSANGK